MKTRGYSFFPIVVLAFLAALTFWLDHATRFDEGKRDGKNRHDPDFYVEKLTGRRFGEDGRLVNIMTADRMTHFPDDETTDLVMPNVTFFRPGSPPLHLRSRRGTLSKDGEVADLRDNVYGWREPEGDVPLMTFASSQLTVFKEQEIARTNVPVVLTRGKSVMNGVGMDVDNKVSILRLHSQVKGTIEPRKR